MAPQDTINKFDGALQQIKVTCFCCNRREVDVVIAQGDKPPRKLCGECRSATGDSPATWAFDGNRRAYVPD